MRLSRKCEYACLALVELSRDYGKQLTKASAISDKNNIPKKFLEQILTILKASNYITSERGANGGYSLLRAPSKITLAEVVRLFDGPIAPSPSVSTYFYKESPIQNSIKIVGVLKDVRDYAAHKMENTFFSDLI